MAAIAAIASLPLAAGNLFAMLATVHFNLNGMTNPLILLHAGAGAAPLWRWSMILDIFGYYMPIVPLILLLHGSLRPRGPSWIDLFALCMLAYCLIGAIGGAILATALPTLMREYGAASSVSHQISLQSVFTGYTDGIYRGLWNLLEELLAGIGWIGFGLVLRAERRRLGVVTIVLGAACLVDSLGTAVNIDAIASTGLTVYLILAPTWACWMGVHLLRTASPVVTVDRSLMVSGS
ncbi:MAG: hypothetical protein ABSB54_19660 [Acidimicrobiales bacterium]